MFRKSLYSTMFCALVSAGCGSAETLPKDAVKTVPVSGLVTLDGKPVTDATVTFQAPAVGADGKPVPSAVGKTDSSGRYQLTTYRPNDGAAPATYLVSILKVETPKIETPTGGEYVPPEAKKDVKPVKPTFLVPEKYSVPGTSGLSGTVKDGKNDIPFELKSK